MAANDLVAEISALGFVPPSTNYPQLKFNNTAATHTYAFDQTTVETLYFFGFLPFGITPSSGLKVLLTWFTAATSGNVVWAVKFARVANDTETLAALGSSFDALTSVVAAASGTTNNMKYSEISVPFSDIDGLQPGEYFLMALERTANSGSDTIAADVELIGASIREA